MFMLKNRKQMISFIMSFFLCCSSVNIPVYAEETGYEENTEEVTEVIETVQEEETEIPETEEMIPEEQSPEDQAADLENTEEEYHQEETSEEPITEEVSETVDPDPESIEEPEEKPAEETEEESDAYDAYGDFEYNTVSGGVTITKYTGSSTDIVVPAEINGNQVVEVSENAFKGNTAIASVTFEGALNKINRNAFDGCTSLRSIDISAGLGVIGNYAFKGCTSLQTITLPEGLTEIGQHVFEGCTRITSMTIPSTVTKIGTESFNSLQEIIFAQGISKIPDNACNKAVKLTKAVIPESVTEIGSYAFAYCSLLASAELPSTVKKIGLGAFRNDTALTNITLPEGLTNIGQSAFEACTGIQSFTIPTTVTDVGQSAFTAAKEIIFAEGTVKVPNGACYNAANVTSVTIPDGVTEIGNNAFREAKSLAQISLPSGITKIGQNAFHTCTSLTSIVIPEGVTELDSYAFAYCDQLASVKLPSTVKTIGLGAFRNDTALTGITLPEGLTNIGQSAFEACTGIQSFTIPTTVTDVGKSAFTAAEEIIFAEGTVKIPNGACYNAANVTSVTIPEGVTEIGTSAFREAKSLAQISLPSGITKIGQNAFHTCTSLTSIVIPEGVTELDSYAFAYCDQLASVKLPSTVKTIGLGAFRNDTALTNITLPEGLTNIGQSAFETCTGIQSFTIPTTVTDVGKSAFTAAKEIIFAEGTVKIANNACYSAANLTHVIIPESVTEIGNHAFREAKSLAEIDLPSSLTAIGQYAFNQCTALTSVTIPDDVKVNIYAFGSCTNLTKVTLGDEDVLLSNAFAKSTAITEVIFGYDVDMKEDSFPDLSMSGTCGENITYQLDFKTRILNLNGTGAMQDYESPDEQPWKHICTNTLGIEISEGITSIGNHAFDGMRNVEFAKLPETVEHIGDYAFRNCDGLINVEIPASVTSVGSYVFAENDRIRNVMFFGDAPEFGEGFLDKCIDAGVIRPAEGIRWAPNMEDLINASRVVPFDYAESIDVVLLLDVSDSMEEEMGKLKKAVCSFITSVGERMYNVKFTLMPYSYSSYVKCGYSMNLGELRYYINQLTAAGGTHYSEALSGAETQIKASGRAQRHVIVMFSDGEPTDYDIPAMYKQAERLHDQYTIFTVGLISSSGAEYSLKKVASTPDHYYSANDMDGLVDAFALLGVNLERTDETQITMNYQNNTYDLREPGLPFIFQKDSREKVDIKVIPAYTLGEYDFVALADSSGYFYEESEEGFFKGHMFGMDVMGDGTYRIAVCRNSETSVFPIVLEEISLPIMIDDTVKVTYHMNDGTNRIFDTERVYMGQNFWGPDEEPERNGYIFRGWYENPQCAGMQYFTSENSLNRMSLTGNIDLYAKWESTFAVDEELWSFTNTCNYFQNPDCQNLKDITIKYEIRKSDLNKLYATASKDEKAQIKINKKEKWGGSCYGMAAAIVLAYKDKISVSQFKDKRYEDQYWKNTHDAEIYINKNGNKDVGNIESMINFYYLRQLLNVYYNEFKAAKKSPETKNLKALISKMSQNPDDPYVINVYMSYKDSDNKTQSGYHALVGYHLTQEEDGTYHISLYDPNTGPDAVWNLTVRNDDGHYEKEMEQYYLLVQNIEAFEILHTLSADDLLRTRYLSAPDTLSGTMSLTGQEEVYSLETGYGSFTITDGVHTAVIAGGEVESGDLDIVSYGQVNNVYGDEKYAFELPVLTDGYYRITTAADSDTYTALSYDHESESFYTGVRSQGSGTISFGSDGSVDTQFDTPCEQTITIMSNMMMTPWDQLDITAVTGSLKAVPSGKSVLITSDEQTTMSVSAEADFNSVTYENVPVSSSGTTVTESSEGICTVIYDNETIHEEEFGYSVIFDSGTGSEVPSLSNVHKGSLLEKPSDPERPGYFFEGWYKDEKFTEQWDFSADTVQEDMVLYAGWSLDPNYFVTVTFKLRGRNDIRMTVQRGYELPADEYPLSASGEQIQWYKDSKCTEEWTVGTTISQHTVLYSEGWKDKTVSSITLDHTELTVMTGESKQLNAVSEWGTSVDVPLVWSSDNEETASVSSDGLVTGLREGSAVITASTEDGSLSAQCTVTVVKVNIPVAGISLADKEASVAVRDTYQLTAVLEPENATNKEVIWKSEDESIASVNSYGIITGVSEGTTVITATTADGGFTDTCTVTVYRVPAEKIIIDEENSDSEIEFGNTGSVRIEFEPANTTNQNLTWTSSDETVATVDENGIITAVGEGTAVITATSEDGGFTVSREIKVYFIHAESVEFMNDSYSVTVGKTVKVEAAVLPENATMKDVVFTSDHPEIASVSEDGTVTGVSEGSTIITATTKDGNLMAETTVTVLPAGFYVKEIDEEYAYIGTAIKPVPAVYDSGRLLTAGKDYTVTYKNNTNAKTFDGEDRSSFEPAKGDKTPYILITGKGNYSGKTYVPFSIGQIDINDADKVYIEESITLKANGKVQRPVPVITFNGKTVSSKEYTLTYLEADDPNGEEIVLDKKTGPKAAGTYTIRIEGKGNNFIGTKDVTLMISDATEKQKAVALSKAITITAVSEEYDGNEKLNASITPKAAYEGIITEDDYTVTYTKNVNAGTATVTATGKGIYTGTVKKTFKITPRLYAEHKDEFRFEVNDAVYSKGGAIPEVHVYWNEEELIVGTDYTLKYVNNKQTVADGKVKITFKGNFKGSAEEQPFKITKKDLASVNITAKDLVYKKGKYKSTPVLTDSDGKKLKAGVDYEKTYEYTGNIIDGDAQPNTEITVTVTGKGNYTGTVSTTYRILETGKDISKAVFKIANQEYTGSEILITDMSQFTGTDDARNAYITVNKQKEYLVLGEDFEVVPGSYVKNINKGTAKVTFQGIGEYGGTKTVSFKIGQRSIQEYWKGIFGFFGSMF